MKCVIVVLLLLQVYILLHMFTQNIENEHP